MKSDVEYRRELEAWASTLAQAMRDIVALAVSDDIRPRLVGDVISSLKGLVVRMKRAAPTDQQ